MEGKKVQIGSPLEAIKNGIGYLPEDRKLQGLFLEMSIEENVVSGNLKRIIKRRFIDKRRISAIAEEYKEKLHIAAPSIKGRVINLSGGNQQKVVIGRWMTGDFKVFIFDQPTTGVDIGAKTEIYKQMVALAKKGCGIIYISHKMDEILRISDDITVMRDGQWVATRPAKELTMEEIIKLMVGRELTNRFPPKTNKPGDVILDVQHIAGKYTRLKDATFQLRKGEVLGIAGLDGSGRTEVLENLFGSMTREGGTITLHGKEIQNRTPKESIKNGFALLTEERRATGIFGIRDIRENTVISSLKDYLMGGICLSDKQMKEKTEWAIQAMHIKTPSQKTQIRSLSGGNQQKVIIGRWLLTKPEVLLLDEPTRGIDVGAKYEIYQLIIDLANEGKGVIMVSSEMPELLGVCDRIIVMSGGQVAGEVDAKNTSQEEILTLAAKYV